MAVLVREHADARVLGLHDVVRQLEVGAGDGRAAGDRRGVRPDGVRTLGAAAAGLVLARVHEHHVVDEAVGLEDVAVSVAVELVLDVVVIEGEVGDLRHQGVGRVDGQLCRTVRVVGVPDHSLRGARLELAVLVTGAAVGVSVTSRVGRETGVSVGRGVSVGVSVGGMGVAVGMAAWVCATIVKAAATAVFWMSSGLTVGTGSAPQAPSSSARRIIGIEKRFMGCECLLRC